LSDVETRFPDITRGTVVIVVDVATLAASRLQRRRRTALVVGESVKLGVADVCADGSESWVVGGERASWEDTSEDQDSTVCSSGGRVDYGVVDT